MLFGNNDKLKKNPRIKLQVLKNFFHTMTVHRDYEIKININELIEKRIPCCDLLHPDNCLTEQQVSEIAHDVSKDLNLHDIYKQVDQHIMNYATATGVDNKSHWIEPNLPDLDRDIKEEVEIDFE